MLGFLCFGILLVGTATATACPSGSIGFQDNCYFFIRNASQYSTAENVCNSLAGHLVSIHNGFVNAWLASQGSQIFPSATVPYFWIGLNGLMVPGNWSWMDNSVYDFSNWDSSGPSLPSRNCIALSMRSGESGQWSVTDCYKEKPFVCELTPPTPPTTPTPRPTTPRPHRNCSEGWYYFEPTGSCYGIDRYQGFANWTLAEQICQSQDAHLVSIHSPEEATFVSAFGSVVGAKLWTGLYSTNNQFSWHWEDGSQIDYLPWAPGSPSRSVPSCAYIWLSRIYDLPCENALNFVCKKY